MLISRDDPLPLEVNPTYNTSLLDGTIPMMIDEYPKKTMELDTSPPLLLLLELLPWVKSLLDGPTTEKERAGRSSGGSLVLFCCCLQQV
jgi:hypothetical protein